MVRHQVRDRFVFKVNVDHAPRVQTALDAPRCPAPAGTENPHDHLDLGRDQIGAAVGMFLLWRLAGVCESIAIALVGGSLERFQVAPS